MGSTTLEILQETSPSEPTYQKWSQVVKETAERGHKGYYHQQLVGRIEALEMQGLQEALGRGRLLHERGPVRLYWHEFDRVIGASKGEETCFVLLEYNQNGDVHGHPVTWQELLDKGANDEDRDVR